MLAARDVDQYIGRSPWVIVDLRDYEEYAAGHIRGAHNLPYEFFDHYIKRLPKGRTYILYCNYGSVSMLAGKKMEAEGYDVLSIGGGIAAYRGQLIASRKTQG